STEQVRVKAPGNNRREPREQPPRVVTVRHRHRAPSRLARTRRHGKNPRRREPESTSLLQTRSIVLIRVERGGATGPQANGAHQTSAPRGRIPDVTYPSRGHLPARQNDLEHRPALQRAAPRGDLRERHALHHVTGTGAVEAGSIEAELTGSTPWSCC